MGIAVGPEDDAGSGKDEASRDKASGANAPSAAAMSATPELMPFYKAFEQELKAVQARRRVAKEAFGEGRYYSEDYSARVGGALARGPGGALTTQFNFAQMPGEAREFLFAHRYEAGEPVTEADGLNLTGLCMSGGGIRSAAINLGVTQALDALSPAGRSDVIDSLDYLSTVSGGNYIGTSIAAGMMQPKDVSKPFPSSRYPFESKTDGSETPETQHLRDYSSYLTPNGISDVIANLLIVARGLVANVLMLLTALLLLAWLQLLLTPTTDFLADPLSLKLARQFLPAGVSWPDWAGGFVISLVLAGVILFLMLIWTCLKRWLSYRSGLSSREKLSRFMIVFAVFTVLFAVFEWQPSLLAAMRSGPSPAEAASGGSPDWLTWLFGNLDQAGVVLGPAAVTLLAFGSKLINVIKAATGDASFTGKARRYIGKALLFILGISVPILLWVSFLNLVDAGICSPTGLEGACVFRAPGWFVSFGEALPFVSQPSTAPITWLYFWGALAGLAIMSSFSPNANSLHQLYRDRLSRAFLLERSYLGENRRNRPTHDPRTGERLPESDDYTFSSLKLESDGKTLKPAGAWAPYLLVNTAINLQADYLGQRGRQADIFTLGPIVSGSDATGYVRTVDLEERHSRLTLASGLAISGAAASANMGGNTIPVITFSLAALNVRLGYWLPNPAKLYEFKVAARQANGLPERPPWKQKENGWGHWYFLRELFGWIGKSSSRVYLTDGGHIENLGLYELTKRRCRVIIAVDAEADQGMVCPSLVKAQLMMRIDHGVRLDLPWQEISEATRAAGEKIGTARESAVQEKAGPHVAVGRIIYRQETGGSGEDVHGVLIYIKSSMSGDENDGIRDYKRRYGDFPHETTLDQFFSEEQFEVYRALGFHMALGFFTGNHDAAFWTPEDATKRANFFRDVENAMKSIAIPEDNIARIMGRARTRAAVADKARHPQTPPSDPATPSQPAPSPAPPPAGASIASPSPSPPRKTEQAVTKRTAK
jgi:hypothetical protein